MAVLLERERGRGAERCSGRSLNSFHVEGVVLGRLRCSLLWHMEAGYRNRRKLGILNGETCGKYHSSLAPVWFLNIFPGASKGDATRPYLREPVLE